MSVINHIFQDTTATMLLVIVIFLGMIFYMFWTKYTGLKDTLGHIIDENEGMKRYISQGELIETGSNEFNKITNKYEQIKPEIKLEEQPQQEQEQQQLQQQLQQQPQLEIPVEEILDTIPIDTNRLMKHASMPVIEEIDEDEDDDDDDDGDNECDDPPHSVPQIESLPENEKYEDSDSDTSELSDESELEVIETTVDEIHSTPIKSKKRITLIKRKSVI